MYFKIRSMNYQIDTVQNLYIIIAYIHMYNVLGSPYFPLREPIWVFSRHKIQVTIKQ